MMVLGSVARVQVGISVKLRLMISPNHEIGK